jgi:hypothetical protein
MKHDVEHTETLRVIFWSVSREEDTWHLHYYHESRLRASRLGNPEILCGRLIQGAVITIALARLSEGETEATLVIDESDLLPRDFIALMRTQTPVFRTSFGLISEQTDGQGRYFMLLEHEKQGLLLSTGLYSIDSFAGRCLDFDGIWRIRYGLMDHFFHRRRLPPAPPLIWTHPALQLPESFPLVSIDQMTLEFRTQIAGLEDCEFLQSDDWSPAFYRAQARLGYIAITGKPRGRLALMPQLQRSYAVLDWQNLVLDRDLRKIVDSGRMESENIRLQIDPYPGHVLDELERAWSSSSWLQPPYAELMRTLASPPESDADEGFRVWGVRLTVGPQNLTTAGELGYSIGRTYTSLSGFFHRENRAWNNFGKLQMVLLARLLEKAGYAFWNLGHPCMKYKTRLGAEILSLSDFLDRWDPAAQGPSPDLAGLDLPPVP